MKADTAQVILNDHRVCAKIAWQRDDHTGMEFNDTSISIGAFLKEIERIENHPKAGDRTRATIGQPIGHSEAIQSVLRRAQKAASSFAPILITGETGTGKDLLASYIHFHSANRGGPFVPLNCASLSGQMAESDLFGHKRGAFTGATSDRIGAVTRAQNGTLFLDEFAELELKEQARLLRFTQSGQYMRIGDEKVMHSNARLICATNKKLRDEIKYGHFRSDLFFRMNTISIHLPPLRERRGDIPALRDHFIQKHSLQQGTKVHFDRAAEEWMVHYDWPGNIRQLSNAILQCVTLCDSPLIGRSDIEFAAMSTTEIECNSRDPAPAGYATPSPAARMVRPLEDVISEAIAHAIKEHGGSIPKAAHALRVSPSTIYRRLESKERPPVEQARLAQLNSGGDNSLSASEACQRTE